nr:uncharacterized protein CTRU02_01319 [Colletotrichum truncatum]KAF6799640.1 hypothetical protein CTRU02_01319 [Colletotrichum truncatum]
MYRTKTSPLRRGRNCRTGWAACPREHLGWFEFLGTDWKGFQDRSSNDYDDVTAANTPCIVRKPLDLLFLSLFSLMIETCLVGRLLWLTRLVKGAHSTKRTQSFLCGRFGPNLKVLNILQSKSQARSEMACIHYVTTSKLMVFVYEVRQDGGG